MQGCWSHRKRSPFFYSHPERERGRETVDDRWLRDGIQSFLLFKLQYSTSGSTVVRRFHLSTTGSLGCECVSSMSGEVFGQEIITTYASLEELRKERLSCHLHPLSPKPLCFHTSLFILY